MQPIDSQFTVPPFPAFPSITRYVPLGSIQDALERIGRSISAREAISLVIGPPGTGKSLVCALLAEQFRDTHDVVVLGETPIESSAAFQRHLLHHLGANFETIAEGDLQLALVDRVCDEEAPAGGLLIVVDEAQSLSPEVIETIRMATNIMREGQPRVFAVLCGGMKLEETLIASSLEAFAQRVSTRCYLHAMNCEETGTYIKETIRGCGADPNETITDEAISAVHHACVGVPRLVNQIMTEAIDCAAERDQVLIDEKVIDGAWAKLQQLPSPMVEEPKISLRESTVEFGELSEMNPVGQIPSETASAEPRMVDPVESDVIEPAETPIQDVVMTDNTVTELEDVASTPVEEFTEIGGGQMGGEVLTELSPESLCEVALCHAGCSEDILRESDESIATTDAVTEPQSDLKVVGPMDMVTEDTAQEIVEEPAVDTSTERPTSESISPVALFGSFDEEEELTLGSGVSPVEPMAMGKAVLRETTESDLESVLHQEIIGISTVAASGLEVTADSQPEREPMEEVIDFPKEPEEIVEDFIAEPVEPETEVIETSGNQALWLTETEEGTVVQDDTDLLVVEDEVDIVRTDRATRIDSQEQTVSVDFQAMLARMRSGT